MDYYQKYIKYKNKYLELKKILLGLGNKEKRKATELEEEELAKLIGEIEEDHSHKKVNYGNLIKSDIFPIPQGISRVHVNDIKYTQKTISHSFSDGQNRSIHTISSNIDKLIKRGNLLHKILTDEDIRIFLNINPADMILSCLLYRGQIYSCNNRRLCMYKTLFRKGIFDGFINIKYVENCAHQIECLNPNCDDILIQYGDRSGKRCSEI